jgi:hypothetical protein
MSNGNAWYERTPLSDPQLERAPAASAESPPNGDR